MRTWRGTIEVAGDVADLAGAEGEFAQGVGQALGGELDRVEAAGEIAGEADVVVHDAGGFGEDFGAGGVFLLDLVRGGLEEEGGRGQFLAEAVVQVLPDAAFLALADEEELLLDCDALFHFALEAFCSGR